MKDPQLEQHYHKWKFFTQYSKQCSPEDKNRIIQILNKAYHNPQNKSFGDFELDIDTNLDYKYLSIFMNPAQEVQAQYDMYMQQRQQQQKQQHPDQQQYNQHQQQHQQQHMQPQQQQPQQQGRGPISEQIIWEKISNNLDLHTIPQKDRQDLENKVMEVFKNIKHDYSDEKFYKSFSISENILMREKPPTIEMMHKDPNIQYKKEQERIFTQANICYQMQGVKPQQNPLLQKFQVHYRDMVKSEQAQKSTNFLYEIVKTFEDQKLYEYIKKSKEVYNDLFKMYIESIDAATKFTEKHTDQQKQQILLDQRQLKIQLNRAYIRCYKYPPQDFNSYLQHPGIFSEKYRKEIIDIKENKKRIYQQMQQFFMQLNSIKILQFFPNHVQELKNKCKNFPHRNPSDNKISYKFWQENYNVHVNWKLWILAYKYPASEQYTKETISDAIRQDIQDIIYNYRYNIETKKLENVPQHIQEKVVEYERFQQFINQFLSQKRSMGTNQQELQYQFEKSKKIIQQHPLNIPMILKEYQNHAFQSEIAQKYNEKVQQHKQQQQNKQPQQNQQNYQHPLPPQNNLNNMYQDNNNNQTLDQNNQNNFQQQLQQQTEINQQQIQSQQQQQDQEKNKDPINQQSQQQQQPEKKAPKKKGRKPKAEKEKLEQEKELQQQQSLSNIKYEESESHVIEKQEEQSQSIQQQQQEKKKQVRKPKQPQLKQEEIQQNQSLSNIKQEIETKLEEKSTFSIQQSQSNIKMEIEQENSNQQQQIQQLQQYSRNIQVPDHIKNKIQKFKKLIDESNFNKRTQQNLENHKKQNKDMGPEDYTLVTSTMKAVIMEQFKSYMEGVVKQCIKNTYFENNGEEFNLYQQQKENYEEFYTPFESQNSNCNNQNNNIVENNFGQGIDHEMILKKIKGTNKVNLWKQIQIQERQENDIYDKFLEQNKFFSQYQNILSKKGRKGHDTNHEIHQIVLQGRDKKQKFQDNQINKEILGDRELEKVEYKKNDKMIKISKEITLKSVITYLENSKGKLQDVHNKHILQRVYISKDGRY